MLPVDWNPLSGCAMMDPASVLGEPRLRVVIAGGATAWQSILPGVGAVLSVLVAVWSVYIAHRSSIRLADVARHRTHAELIEKITEQNVAQMVCILAGIDRWGAVAEEKWPDLETHRNILLVSLAASTPAEQNLVRHLDLLGRDSHVALLAWRSDFLKLAQAYSIERHAALGELKPIKTTAP